MSKSLQQMVLNELENKKHNKQLIKEITSQCGYSSLGNFKRVLTNEDKDIEKLDGFIEVARMLFPDRFDSLLVTFAEQLNPDRITARLLLEYVTLYHMYDIKLLLINRMKDSSKKDVVTLANVYEIQHKNDMRELTFEQSVEELFCYKNKSLEARVFSKIAIIYCYYNNRNINMLNFCLEELEYEINQIKNDFIRHSYLGRLFRIKIDINLHTGKIGELIENLFVLDKALPPTKSMAYLQIGNSYMMKSYDKAMYYYNLAMQYKNHKTENQIQQSINFASLVWGHLENFRHDGTNSNELFYYVVSGNRSEAIRTLDQIDFDSLTLHQKAFNCYYRGLLFKDKTYFYNSIEYFNHAGEKFYKQLPVMQLKQMGEHEAVLKALSA